VIEEPVGSSRNEGNRTGDSYTLLEEEIIMETGSIVETQGYVLELVELIKYTAGFTILEEHWTAKVVNEDNRIVNYVHEITIPQ
jgi:hypothetical protein